MSRWIAAATPRGDREAASLGPVRVCIVGAHCPASQVCPICESCEEHCLSGGSGACVAAHDDWLAGGDGGVTGVARGKSPGPERAREMRVALLLARDELAAENGLRRCACGGLEDPARPHRHAG